MRCAVRRSLREATMEVDYFDGAAFPGWNGRFSEVRLVVRLGSSREQHLFFFSKLNYRLDSVSLGVER